MSRRRAPRIACIGEALVDMIGRTPGTLRDVALFEKCVGGEGANVAVGLARLGSVVHFIGRRGNDSFGEFIKRELTSAGVATRWLTTNPRHNTRLAFVALDANGGRDFAFWENTPAGTQLRSNQIPLDTLIESEFVCIAPLLLTGEPSRTTVLSVAQWLSKRRHPVAFDPNLRPALWGSVRQMKEVTLHMVRSCAIVRLNSEEARTLTAATTPAAAARKLLSLGPSLVVITMGAQGCYFATHRVEGYVPGFSVNAVDTTGCGDAFLAALLHGLAHTRRPADSLSADELHSICIHANAVGALTSLRQGGASAIPTPAEVLRFMKSHEWGEA